MLLRANENLEDLIVRILARKQKLAAKQIHKNICNETKSYSLQGVYKELGKLQNEGVVVKNKGVYSLRLPWILELVSLADTMARQYIESIPGDLILPSENKKTTWYFTSLFRLNDFWSQILLHIIQQSTSKTVLAWNAHPWVHLAQTRQEAQFIRSLKLAHSKMYLIVGGKTALDTWAQQFWDPSIVEYSFNKSTYDNNRNEYINIIDEYILTIKLTNDMADQIEQLYQQTTSIDVLNVADIIELFNSRTKAKITLEKNHRKAKIHVQRFKRFFGNIKLYDPKHQIRTTRP